MAFAGDFLLPGIDDGVKNKFEWKATYQPKDVRASPTSAATPWSRPSRARTPTSPPSSSSSWWRPDNMAAFCEEAVELPTLQSLVDQKLDYATRPDLMPMFASRRPR